MGPGEAALVNLASLDNLRAVVDGLGGYLHLCAVTQSVGPDQCQRRHQHKQACGNKARAAAQRRLEVRASGGELTASHYNGVGDRASQLRASVTRVGSSHRRLLGAQMNTTLRGKRSFAGSFSFELCHKLRTLRLPFDRRCYVGNRVAWQILPCTTRAWPAAASKGYGN